MAFKMSPIGKKKCPYSPMQKRGLINPSPVKENGDVKTIKFKANKNKKSDPFEISQAKIDEAQARVNKKAKETGSYQEETIKATRGNLEGYASAWKRNKGGVRDKYKNYKDWVAAAEAWWEKKNKKVVGSPDPGQLKIPREKEQKISQTGGGQKLTDNQASVGNKVELIYNPETRRTERVVVQAPKIDYQTMEHGQSDMEGAQFTQTDGTDQKYLTDITGNQVEVQNVDLGESYADEPLDDIIVNSGGG
jgi:hypothetical protein